MADKIMECLDETLQAKSKGNFMVDRRKSYVTPHTRTYIVVGKPEARVRDLPGLAEDLEAVLAYNDMEYAVTYRANPARFEIDNDNPPLMDLKDVWGQVRQASLNELKFLSFFTYRGRERRLLTPSIDAARNTHLLFAGSTGSGKTVAAQTALTTAMMMNSPRVLSFVVCDPNGDGFTFLRDCPHMARPIAVDDEEILESARSVQAEMNRRARLRIPKSDLGHLVLVIDEINSQFSTNPEVMGIVEDIARRGRGRRVHAVLIGQKMTASMPPNIRVNITGRTVGRLDSAMDAKATCGEASQAHKLQVEQGRFEFTNQRPYGANEIVPVFAFMAQPRDYSFYAKEIIARWKDEESFSKGTAASPDHEDLIDRVAAQAVLSVPNPTPQTIALAVKAERNGLRLNWRKAVALLEKHTGREWEGRGAQQLCAA